MSCLLLGARDQALQLVALDAHVCEARGQAARARVARVFGQEALALVVQTFGCVRLLLGLLVDLGEIVRQLFDTLKCLLNVVVVVVVVD